MAADTTFYKQMTIDCKKKPKRFVKSLLSSPIVLKFSLNSMIAEVIEETSMWLIQGGIFTYLYENYEWTKFIRGQTLENDSEPQVFSIENVSYGFNIWLIACAVSTLGFVVEWLQVLLGKVFRKIFNFAQ
jgi:hypothetical protein